MWISTVVLSIDMLGIPVELYTPIFAVARIVAGVHIAWKRLLEMERSSDPSYKSVMEEL